MLLRIIVILLMAVAAGCSGDESGTPTAPTGELAQYGAPTAEFIQAIAVDTPTSRMPVRFGGTIAPAAINAGDPAILVVRINTADSWHINAVGRQSEMLMPTSISLELPAGIRLIEDWHLPDARTIEGSDGPVYEGDFIFYHHLRAEPSVAPGEYPVSCTIEYQACDSRMCLPPTSENITLKLTVN